MSSLKIATYNIKYDGYPPKDMPIFENRKNAIISVIKGSHSDIICLQECSINAFSQLSKTLRGYRGVFQQHNNGKRDGVAIFYQTRRFTKIKSQTIRTIRTDNNGLMLDLKDKDTGKIFRVAVVHLKGGPTPGRKDGEKQLARTCEMMDEDDEADYKIIYGDFNENALDTFPKPRRNLLESQNYHLVSRSDKPTDIKHGKMMDYIFVKGNLDNGFYSHSPKSNCHIIIGNVDKHASDHALVATTLYNIPSEEGSDYSDDGFDEMGDGGGGGGGRASKSNLYKKQISSPFKGGFRKKIWDNLVSLKLFSELNDKREQSVISIALKLSLDDADIESEKAGRGLSGAIAFAETLFSKADKELSDQCIASRERVLQALAQAYIQSGGDIAKVPSQYRPSLDAGIGDGILSWLRSWL